MVRELPSELIESAGLKLVDVLSKEGMQAKTEIAIGVRILELDGIVKNKRYLPKVREAALNAKDALQLRRSKDRGKLEKGYLYLRHGGIVPVDQRRFEKAARK